MNIRAEIMAQPAEDRLELALQALEAVYPASDFDPLAWKEALGLTGAKARLCHLLLSRAGSAVSHEALLVAANPQASLSGDGPNTDIVKVYAVHLRRAFRSHKLPGRGLIPDWGTGYSLCRETAAAIVPMLSAIAAEREAIQVPYRTPPECPDALARAGAPWSDQDDADLTQMYQRGDHLTHIAYELERTERAIRDRIQTLSLERSDAG